MKSLNPIFFLSLLLVNTLFMLQVEAQHNPYLERRRVTKLRFYLQDIIGGDNRTVYAVAKSNLSDVSPSKFGIVAVLDNLITSGPEIESGEIGRMQGVIALSDLHVPALSMLLNVVFTHGEYEGSTFSFLGRNPLMDKVREVPVVGGTGAFRMALGYIITRTHTLDEAGMHNVFEYNVNIFHMDDGLMSWP